MLEPPDYTALWREAEALALRAVLSGSLIRLGPKKMAGKIAQPINAPSRYPEYACMAAILSELIRTRGYTTLLDIGSPKLFSLLLAARTRAELCLTDVHEPAVDEARALSHGLSREARGRIHFAVADARAHIDLPPSFGGKAELVFSMSVVEHVLPAQGGDVAALRSLASQMTAGGALVISVPVRARAEVEYFDAPIYGVPLDEHGKAFHQRIYGPESLRDLVREVSDVLALERLVHVVWPESPLFHAIMSPRFPAELRALAGPWFPAIARRTRLEEHGAGVPDTFVPGDAVLVFRPVN